MNRKYTRIGNDGASLTGRGLVAAKSGERNGRPEEWDEFDPGTVEFFDRIDLDFDEDQQTSTSLRALLLPADQVDPFDDDYDFDPVRDDPLWTEEEVWDRLASDEILAGYFRGRNASVAVNRNQVRDSALTEQRTRRTTDVGNAERFAAQHGANVRYCYEWGSWLAWDGRRWIVDRTGEIARLAKRTALSIYQEAANATDKREREDLAKWAVTSERRERLNAMTSLAQSEQPIPVKVETLDAEPWLLNCENGTLDLRTGELREHRREDYLTKLCPIEYPTEPGIDPELWHGFLDRIFSGKAELIGFVRRLSGMALVGQVVEHVLPIFYGTGANGKSVFLETVCNLLGSDYAMAAPHGFLIASKSDKHPTEVADLHGMRLVAANETDEGCRLSEALVKQLTGGDQLRARRMRQDFWGFTPSHTVILTTNHKPTVRGTDNGIWRRIRLVPFTVTIPDEEQDGELKKKLEGEWPAILRWIVSGCVEWQREGLQAPDEVLAATNSYRADMDVLGEFLKECCIEGAGCHARASELYKAYSAWAEARGEHVASQTKFGLRLSDRKFEKGHDQRNCVVYKGLGLLKTS